WPRDWSSDVCSSDLHHSASRDDRLADRSGQFKRSAANYICEVVAHYNRILSRNCNVEIQGTAESDITAAQADRPAAQKQITEIEIGRASCRERVQIS